MRDTQIFRRGQVWFINDDFKGCGSIQSKSRPYVVVSNDKCNANSPVIHMAPLTTQVKTNLPTHVKIYDPTSNLDQIILIEQTMPKSVPDIISIAKYRYTLSDEIMRKVDKALAIQFAIQFEEQPSIDDFEKLLDKVKELKLAEIKAEADKLTQSRANNYINRLLEEVDKIKISSEPAESGSLTTNSELKKSYIIGVDLERSSTTNSEPEEHISLPSTPLSNEPMSQIDKFNRRLQKSREMQSNQSKREVPQTSSSSSTPKLSSKRNRWTLERKHEFLADSKNPNMPKSEILAKYNMTNSTYATTLSKFRKELASDTTTSESTTNQSNELVLAKKFLADYDSKPISEVMKIYGIPDKQSAVARAASYRLQLEEKDD